ncbi:YoaK family protein [Streptacidiphilus cavernicola]|uniref:YoaK family protein n=1 Tax=Streptacidiphilus cavernicola TaxID=3342716 RepID=A0ABV6VNS3_9ACTN
MITALRDAWATLVPDLSDRPENRHGPLPPLLVALTVVTGLVDAFSYLVLGRVFVANMTGNVVFIAFALAGSPDFYLAASLTALAAFALGALLGGRLGVRFAAHRGRLLLAALAAEAVLVLAAYLCCLLLPHAESGHARYVLVVLLGLAMGAQNAAARRLAVPDLTTTVLTLTITGIAADSRLAGGSDSRIGRRLLSALSMFLGALVGGLAALHGRTGLPLLLAAVLLVLAAAALARPSRSTPPWTRTAA